MIFKLFENKSIKLTNAKLIGARAHFIMVPEIRMKELQNKMDTKNAKSAAVLILFYPNECGETCFLLTLRASYNGTHSDQISFPGGKFELSDQNLMHTALREAHEETDLKMEDVKILKQLSDVYIPPSNFLVSPFIGILNYSPTFIKNHEVEELIQVKLNDLLDDKNLSFKKLSTSYAKNMQVPCFMLNNHVVWGATAMILSEIKQLFKLM